MGDFFLTKKAEGLSRGSAFYHLLLIEKRIAHAIAMKSKSEAQ